MYSRRRRRRSVLGADCSLHGPNFWSSCQSRLASITLHAYKSVCDEIPEDIAACLQLQAFLESRPKTSKAMDTKPSYIQTDACSEWQEVEMFAGIRAILFDFHGRAFERFSAELLNFAKKQMSVFVRVLCAVLCVIIVLQFDKSWNNIFLTTMLCFNNFMSCSQRCRAKKISCYTDTLVFLNPYRFGHC